MSADLFAPFTLGDLMLANRLVMAPMTRNRADVKGVASPLNAADPTTFYGGGEAGYTDYPVSRSEYLAA